MGTADVKSVSTYYYYFYYILSVLNKNMIEKNIIKNR